MEIRDRRTLILWAGVVLTAFIGGAIRVRGAWDLTLSFDDFGHLQFSGFGYGVHLWQKSPLSLMEVIRRSYLDAHPPLRNIILFYLVPIADSPNLLRAVAIIPGTLLIVSIPYLLFLLRFSYASIILSALGIAFSPLLTLLSMETRGYMLMLFLVSLYLIFLEMYFRRPNLHRLFLFSVPALLAVLTEYSAAFCVFPFGLSYLLFKDRRLSQRQLFSVLCAGIVIFLNFIAQLYFLQHNDTFDRIAGFGYLNPAITAGIETWPAIFIQTLSAFRPFVLPQKLNILLPLLFFIGIFACLCRRNYLMTCCVLLPIASLLLAAFFEKYPFISGRQCVILQISFVLGVMYGVDTCLRFIRRPALTGSVVAVLGIFQFVAARTPSAFLENGIRYIELSSFSSVATKASRFQEALIYVRTQTSENQKKGRIAVAFSAPRTKGQVWEKSMQSALNRNLELILNLLKTKNSSLKSSQEEIQILHELFQKRELSVLMYGAAWTDLQNLAKSMSHEQFKWKMEQNALLKFALSSFGSEEYFWLMPFVHLPKDNRVYPTSQIKRTMAFEQSFYDITFHPNHFVFRVERHQKPELPN